MRIDGITVNGQYFPSPVPHGSFDISYEDVIGDSFVTASGRTVGDYIRTKNNITLSWEYMPPDELTRLSNAIAKLTFMAEFSTLDGRLIQIEVRKSGGISAQQLGFNALSGQVEWENVKLSLSEV